LIAIFLLLFFLFEEFLDKFRFAVQFGFGAGDEVFGSGGTALTGELTGKSTDIDFS